VPGMEEVSRRRSTFVVTSAARSAGFTVNHMDFLRHYRPLVNVATRDGGRGIMLTG
jgi:hypothetical protein